MNVISRQRLYEFIKAHRDAESSLAACYSLTKRAKWKHLADLKMDYPGADLVGGLTIFNIKGNDYRLIAYVNYRFKEVLIKEILTHQEYDKGNWRQ